MRSFLLVVCQGLIVLARLTNLMGLVVEPGYLYPLTLVLQMPMMSLTLSLSLSLASLCWLRIVELDERFRLILLQIRIKGVVWRWWKVER